MNFFKIMILNHTHQERRDAFVFSEGKVYESISLVLRRKSSVTKFHAFQNPA